MDNENKKKKNLIHAAETPEIVPWEGNRDHDKPHSKAGQTISEFDLVCVSHGNARKSGKKSLTWKNKSFSF